MVKKRKRSRGTFDPLTGHSHAGEPDPVAARELKLFIDNDAQLNRQQAEPIRRNLERRRQKGEYDRNKAVILYEYLANNGAKKYEQEFGVADPRGGIGIIFSPATRHKTAEELRDSFEAEAGARRS